MKNKVAVRYIHIPVCRWSTNLEIHYVYPQKRVTYINVYEQKHDPSWRVSRMKESKKRKDM